MNQFWNKTITQQNVGKVKEREYYLHHMHFRHIFFHVKVGCVLYTVSYSPVKYRGALDLDLGTPAVSAAKE